MFGVMYNGLKPEWPPDCRFAPLEGLYQCCSRHDAHERPSFAEVRRAHADAWSCAASSVCVRVHLRRAMREAALP